MLNLIKEWRLRRARALVQASGLWVVQPFHGLWISGPAVAHEHEHGDWTVAGPPGWCQCVAGTHGAIVVRRHGK